jgi:RimJ/RimL family protein N-acetyltransferase
MSLVANEPPRIETARLLLDGHRCQDFAALAALWADPEVTRQIGRPPSDRQESWMRLLRYRGLWPLLGYGYWAVREKATGAFIGDLGFADFHRPLDPPIDGTPEAGWALSRAAHGRGYATEALMAALSWLDATGYYPRSVCLIGPENRASIRVAEKAGYRLERTALQGDGIVLLMGRGAEVGSQQV